MVAMAAAHVQRSHDHQQERETAGSESDESSEGRPASTF